jgi:hypothetical protein
MQHTIYPTLEFSGPHSTTLSVRFSVLIVDLERSLFETEVVDLESEGEQMGIPMNQMDFFKNMAEDFLRSEVEDYIEELPEEDDDKEELEEIYI